LSNMEGIVCKTTNSQPRKSKEKSNIIVCGLQFNLQTCVI
jgi:hypothetical protein